MRPFHKIFPVSLLVFIGCTVVFAGELGYNSRVARDYWEFWQKRFALLPAFCAAAFRPLFGNRQNRKTPFAGKRPGCFRKIYSIIDKCFCCVLR